MSALSLASDLVELLPAKGFQTVKSLDRIGDFAVDPLAAGMQILASKPELLPTLPGFRVPGFDAFAGLAQLVGADPSRHIAMVQALEAFRAQISDALAAAGLECAATGATLSAIAVDVMEKGMRILAAGSFLNPIGAAAAVAGVVVDGLKRAKTELDRLEQALSSLGAELGRATEVALGVLVPGGTSAARNAVDELQRFAGSAMGASPHGERPAEIPPAPALTAPVATAPVATAALPSAPAVGGAAPSPAASAAVQSALSQVGTPYSWGGTGPGGFDCSGLTSWAYRQAGVEIPRVAVDQRVGRQVSYEELAPGDLAVWSGHVAMYAGNGMMVEAGSPVQLNPVRTENIGMPFLGFWRPTG